MKTLYQLREWVGNAYSVVLGRRLRDRKSAFKVAKRLRRAKRDVFLAPVRVNLPKRKAS